jgi:hypothetical protein
VTGGRYLARLAFRETSMTRNPGLAAIVVTLFAHASVGPPARPTPTGKPSDEQTSLLATMDRYMTAISARDV